MSGRVEIITRPERRRRWSEEEKLQLVEEACRPGYSVSQIARQHGINAGQLFTWRRQARAKGLVSDARSKPNVAPALTFTPVKVAEEPTASDPSGAVQSVRRRNLSRGLARIEIELRSGERVHVEVPADADLVASIVVALRRI
jgi:transposase